MPARETTTVPPTHKPPCFCLKRVIAESASAGIRSDGVASGTNAFTSLRTCGAVISPNHPPARTQSRITISAAPAPGCTRTPFYVEFLHRNRIRQAPEKAALYLEGDRALAGGVAINLGFDRSLQLRIDTPTRHHE